MEIDANTGRQFRLVDIDAGLGLTQSIEDRLFTLPGVRPGRPFYGSLATASIDAQTIAQSVRDALLTEQRIHSLEFVLTGDTLRVLINGQTYVLGEGLGPEPIPPSSVVVFGTAALDGSNQQPAPNSPLPETEDDFELTLPATTAARRTWYVGLAAGRTLREISNITVSRTVETSKWERRGGAWYYTGPVFPSDTFMKVEVRT